MYFGLMIIIFIVGYTMIALEHPLKINKSATALLLAAVIWAVYALMGPGFDHESLIGHLGETAEILFFLLGAMTIVEIVDRHDGFSIITDRITTANKRKLLWIISILTFFMSSVLDNLTTAIVICALLRKLIQDQKTRWFFCGMVILAANSLSMKGNVERPKQNDEATVSSISRKQSKIILCMGVGLLLFVPVFKTITHLPPYLGILLGLGILWVTTEIMHKNKPEMYSRLNVTSIIQRVDTPSVLFFLGILMAVSCLNEAGHLKLLAESLDKLGNVYVLSSVIDNVPLVAAAMGMYPIEAVGHFAVDGAFWEGLAYCAGTGGSLLIIGSAAGVAVMGMEKIDFIWYLKKITLWALLGYLAGAGMFYLMSAFVFHT